MSDADAATSPPTTRWLRGELIAKGSFTVAYEARNEQTGELAVAKQIDPTFPRRDVLGREIAILKELRYPNIVKYLDSQDEGGLLSLYLEYVPGRSLQNAIRTEGKLEESVIRSVTSQVLYGLGYLHEQGIIHMNIVPGNVLLQPDGRCVICGFGLATRADEEAENFTLMGTVYYIAPEAVSGSSPDRRSPAVDIWAVGCLLLEMSSGKHPWAGEEMVKVMFNLYQKRAPPVPDGTNLELVAESFMMRCFAINPSDRPSARALQRDPYLANVWTN